MLRVINSNRTERLVSALCERLAEPLPSPLMTELLVVPTPAMGQWLRLQLADRFGICANVEFLYPANFVWEVFRRVLGDTLPAAAPFSPEANTWRVYQALGALPPTPAQAPLRSYLQGSDARHRLDLAGEIARCFDQYLVFRPDWIREWEEGRGDHWQAVMWRELVAARRPVHWVHALQDFGRRLASREPIELPRRATLFGVSALSPGYVEVVSQLAGHMQIDVLVVNPCREYWGDIASPGTVAKAGRDNPHYLDTGHRLLASMGRPGRDLLDRLIEISADGDDRFEPPSDTTLLSLLQADVLDLRDRDGHDLPRLPVAMDDRSLQVHACHSPMREVEVLHDQLLAMFERWPDLLPSQVLIAVTDFERYAPFVTAVFDAIDDERHIPLGAINRLRLDREPIVEAFLSLLDLPRSRLTAESVLLLLELPAVARRFGLDEDDVARIRNWVAEAGIRWGWDAAHRAEQELPAEHQNTWIAGLDRLLLGYALPGDNMQTFGSVLPCDAVEGLAAVTLSSLLRHVESLNQWRRELSRSRTMSQWGEWLLGLVDALFDAGDDEGAIDVVQALREQIGALVSDAQAGECAEALPGEAVAHAFRQRLASASLRPASLRGGVCLADLPAARSLPFEVVCVLGLSDGVYPRADRRVDFDLLRDDWRRGDRSRRDDDRYLFLETLLSARRCLYLSYVGSDQRGGSALPPSVLVSELLDVVERGFVMDDGSDAATHVVRRHPLHAFSRDYFCGRDDLFSYRSEYCIDARHAPVPVAPLVTAPLPPPQDLVVSPDQLAQFFCHPVRALIEQRFGIRLREYEERIDDDEPFRHSRAQAEALRNRLTGFLVAGGDADATYRIESCRGELPAGQVGRLVHARALADARVLASAVRASIAQAAMRTVEVDLAIGGVRIVGSIDGVGPQGLLHSRAVDEIDIWHRLRFWVQHLVLVVAEPALTGPGRLLTLDGSVVFRVPADARQQLQGLVDLYRQGMCEPLAFFPRSSEAYAGALRKAGARRGESPDPLQAARRVWFGSEEHPGEVVDPYHRLAFPGIVPIDGRFAEIARLVIEPLFDALEIAP